MSAPKLADLLPALADLPADKILQFAVALGVPETTIRTAEKNHPGDMDRVKTDSLKWWLNNSDDISWEAIDRALRTKGVDQKNLARTILSEKSSSTTAGGGAQPNTTAKKRKRNQLTSTQQAPRLTDKDMATVTNELWTVRSKFYNLGMNLGINMGTLDVANRKGDDGDALNLVIKTWLQRGKPKPTWSALVQALDGDNVEAGALADEIASKYCPDELNYEEEVDANLESDSKAKKTPRLSPGSQQGQTQAITQNEEDVRNWSVDQVVKYFESTSDCKTFAQFCQKEEIAGGALLKLSEEFLKKYDVKAGIAVNVMDHVKKLNAKTLSEQ